MGSSRADIARLYDEAGFLVHRRCVRMLRDHQEAMDVTQWTFVRAIEVDLDVSDRAGAMRWLYSTANNRCLTLLRNSRVRKRLRETYPVDVRPPAPESPEARAVSRDLLFQALDAVDERTGQVVLATWGQGLTTERAAEMLGVSKRTVIRARKQFEAIIESLRGEEKS